MGTRTTVVDIPQDMQLVDGETLDDITQGNDEVVSTSCRDDGVDNHVDIRRLVAVIRPLMQQFLDDISEILRQRLTYLRAGVFAADITAYGNESVDGDVIPVLYIRLGSLDEFYFLFGIVYQGTQFLPLLVTDIARKELSHLAFDITRGVLQYMEESLALTVQVRKEMLRTLRQIENCLQVDNLCRCGSYRRKRVGEQLQIVHVTVQVSSSLTHIFR